MKVETTPWGTSADFVPHRSCFSTEFSPGSVQIQYQILDTNHSLGSLLPMLLDLVSIYQDGKRKIMGFSLCRISILLLTLWDPRGCISILNRFSLTWVSSSLIPCPLTRREITVCWQALVGLSLRNLARRIVVFDHCKMGNFAFLPPHLARWDGRNSCRHSQKYLLSGKMATLLIIMQGLMMLNIIIPSHATFNFLDHNF